MQEDEGTEMKPIDPDKAVTALNALLTRIDEAEAKRGEQEAKPHIGNEQPPVDLS